MSGTDDGDLAVNRAAKFYPAERDRWDGVDTHPCVEVGGAQVSTYVEDGKLVISADFDTVTAPPFELYGPERDQVPVVVRMSGEDVWRATAGSPAPPAASPAETCRCIMMRLVQLEERIVAHHPRAARDGQVASIIGAIRDEAAGLAELAEGE